MSDQDKSREELWEELRLLRERLTQEEGERQRAEKALRDSESRFQAFMDRCPLMAFMKDTAGRLVYINEPFQRFLRQPLRDILGKTAADFFPAKLARDIADHDAAVLAGNRAIEAVRQVPDPDGVVRQWLVSKFPFQDSAGRRLLGCIGHDVTDRVRAEEALRESRHRLQAMFDNALDAMVLADDAARFVDANPAACELYSYPREELLKLGAEDVALPAERGRVPKKWGLFLAAGRMAGAYTIVRKDGTPREVECRAVANVLPGLHLGVMRDVTERVRAEAALRRAQKMEAVGRLAGGVAHDFNNLLTVIGGHAALLLGRLAPDDPLAAHGQEIHRAADRAAVLTRRLLAFSRRQIIAPKVVDLNDLVRGLEATLRLQAGAGVGLVTRPAPGLDRVKVDADQVRQAVLDLVANALEAMPGGGTLTLETANVAVGESDAVRPPEVRPGPYVVLAVRDTGVGMPPEVLEHLFEPFFTTHDVGAGPGLGLAAVYGTVKQMAGHVEVDSAPGWGTTFRLYFPRAEPAATEPAAPTTTVLVAVAEEMIRRFLHTALSQAGHHVLDAAGGEEAPAVAARHPGPVHLLVADAADPGAGRLAAARPGLRVLYLTDDPAEPPAGGAATLVKPFTTEALLSRVREVLEHPG